MTISNPHLKKRAGSGRLSALFFLTVLLVFHSLSYPAKAEYDAAHPEYLSADDLTASSAILIEADSGEVIFEKDADARMYPASTTKIMTAYLGLMAENIDDSVTVSSTAMDVPADSSVIPLAVGEQVTLRDLLYATMLKSGNDGANAIAEAISGSIPAFVQLMNNAAYSFGCTGTHFNNAHGYHDENHYTTARDMSIIARTAMQNDLFRDIVSKTTYTMPADNIFKERTLTTNNQFMQGGAESSTYYADGIGIKTGNTGAAGYCYVGAAERDGIMLISVVFHATSDAARYTDTIKLMNYGFSQYVSVSIQDLYALNPKVVDISYYALTDENLGKLTLALKQVSSEGSDHIVTSATNVDYLSRNLSSITITSYTREFSAPIEKGEVMGTLTYYNDNKEETVYELIATRSIERREKLAPSIDDIIAYTEADPNPFPRFTFDFAIKYIVLPVALIVLLVKLIKNIFRKGKKKKPRIHTVEPTERYYR